MNRTRTLAALPIAGLVAASAIACGSQHGGSVSSTGSDGAKAKSEASALAGSATTKLSEAQAKMLAAQCLPGDATSSASSIVLDLVFHSSKRHAALSCAKIPRANWQAAANCLVTEHKANPVPKADTTTTEKVARHEAVVNTFAPCILKYHQGATASPSAVPSASKASG